MNWDHVEGQSQRVEGKVREQWSKQTEADRTLAAITLCERQLRLARTAVRAAGEQLRRAERTTTIAELDLCDAKRRLQGAPFLSGHPGRAAAHSSIHFV